MNCQTSTRVLLCLAVPSGAAASERPSPCSLPKARRCPRRRQETALRVLLCSRCLRATVKAPSRDRGQGAPVEGPHLAHREEAVNCQTSTGAAASERPSPCSLPQGRRCPRHRQGTVKAPSRDSAEGAPVEGPHLAQGRHRLPCEAPSALSVERPWPRRRAAPPLPRRACGAAAGGRQTPGMKSSSCPGGWPGRGPAPPRGAKIEAPKSIPLFGVQGGSIRLFGV